MPPQNIRTWILVGALFTGTACSDTEGGGGDETAAPDVCMPSEAQWRTGVEHAMEHACSQCHSDPPTFGAPYSLMEYSSLMEGEPGSRRVDAMADAIASGRMPPAAFPATNADLDQILNWASCGTLTRPPQSGLQVDRPVFVPAPAPRDGSESIDITAGEFLVGQDLRDFYARFDFTGLVDEDRFITRIEGIVDEEAVIHHLVFARNNSDAAYEYLYTWAPGTGAIDFPDGGVRLRPTDTLQLEVHYNNGARIPDVRDSSGVRLWVGAVEGTEYSMVGQGPGAWGFEIPAGSTDEMVEHICTADTDVSFYAVMPHMHEIGSAFDFVAINADGVERSLLSLSGWDFHTQRFYELNDSLRAGEQVAVRCTYNNPFPEPVLAGEATSDEMCFAFTYVTPPVATLCEASEATVLEYTPGECIEAPAMELPTVPVVHVFDTEAPAFAANTTLPPGRWQVAEAWLSSASPLYRAANFTTAGQVVVTDNDVTFDAAMHVEEPSDPTAGGEQIDFSLRGTVAQAPGTAALSCGDPEFGQQITFGVLDGAPLARFAIDDPEAPAALWLRFEPLP